MKVINISALFYAIALASVTSVSGQSDAIVCGAPNPTVPCEASSAPVVCGIDTCPYVNVCVAGSAGWQPSDCTAASTPCFYKGDCLSCLESTDPLCSWENGHYCTAEACISCVTPNAGGLGADKASICALPLAQKPADQIACSDYTDCQTCISSNTCSWERGALCVEGCSAGQNCVTPNYGGLGGNKAAICALAEATSPTPTGCEGITTCISCLDTLKCGWSTGTVCTLTCPGGDATTCVTPNAGGGGLAHTQICAEPAAQPPITLVGATEGEGGNGTTPVTDDGGEEEIEVMPEDSEDDGEEEEIVAEADFAASVAVAYFNSKIVLPLVGAGIAVMIL